VGGNHDSYNDFIRKFNLFHSSVNKNRNDDENNENNENNRNNQYDIWNNQNLRRSITTDYDFN
jgi:hypothetical protein